MVREKNRRATASAAERTITSSTEMLHLNPAMMSRMKREEARQQSLMSQQLRNDMMRMKSDELFPDMHFVCSNQLFLGHKFIIISRSRKLVSEDWFNTSLGALPVLHLRCKTPEDSREYLNILYTSEEMDTYFITSGLESEHDTFLQKSKIEISASQVSESDYKSDTSPSLDSESKATQQLDLFDFKNLRSSTEPRNDVDVDNKENINKIEGGNKASVMNNGQFCLDSEDGSEMSKQPQTYFQDLEKPASSHLIGMASENFSLSVSYINGNKNGSAEFFGEIISPDQDFGEMISPENEPVQDFGEIISPENESVQVFGNIISPENGSVQGRAIEMEQYSSKENEIKDKQDADCQELSSSDQPVIISEYGQTDKVMSSLEKGSTYSGSSSSEMPQTPQDSSQRSFLTYSQTSSNIDLSDSQEQNGTEGSQESLNSSRVIPPECCISQSEGGKDGLVTSPVAYKHCSNLAADLLWGYLGGEHTDCCLLVDGQRFMTHRCILAARSQYFSAMFAGSWCESGQMEIELHGLKAQAVMEILLFLYGAMVNIPFEDITLVMQASDMLGVKGLQEWLTFQIVRDFCHFFHKPCQDCVRMVPDVLIVASQFNMTELSVRAQHWVAAHFRRIWEMQSFGNLPSDLLEECTRAVIDQMSVQNITEIILDAHDLARYLQRHHRSEQVQIAAIHIMDKALAFCAQNFPSLVKSPHFLSWSKGGAWCMDLLEESYTMVVSLLQPEVACEVYSSLRQQLAAREQENENGGLDSYEEVQHLLKKLVERCEWYLHRYIHRVMQCHQWTQIPIQLQQELLQKSSFVPVHTANAVGAQSRVAQKSFKALQDNIVHTVSMLCETNPSLFPTLSQTRKILQNNIRQQHLKKPQSKLGVVSQPFVLTDSPRGVTKIPVMPAEHVMKWKPQATKQNLTGTKSSAASFSKLRQPNFTSRSEKQNARSSASYSTSPLSKSGLETNMLAQSKHLTAESPLQKSIQNAANFRSLQGQTIVEPGKLVAAKSNRAKAEDRTFAAASLQLVSGGSRKCSSRTVAVTTSRSVHSLESARPNSAKGIKPSDKTVSGPLASRAASSYTALSQGNTQRIQFSSSLAKSKPSGEKGRRPVTESTATRLVQTDRAAVRSGFSQTTLWSYKRDLKPAGRVTRLSTASSSCKQISGSSALSAYDKLDLSSKSIADKTHDKIKHKKISPMTSSSTVCISASVQQQTTTPRFRQDRTALKSSLAGHMQTSYYSRAAETRILSAKPGAASKSSSSLKSSAPAPAKKQQSSQALVARSSQKVFAGAEQTRSSQTTGKSTSVSLAKASSGIKMSNSSKQGKRGGAPELYSPHLGRGSAGDFEEEKSITLLSAIAVESDVLSPSKEVSHSIVAMDDECRAKSHSEEAEGFQLREQKETAFNTTAAEPLQQFVIHFENNLIIANEAQSRQEDDVIDETPTSWPDNVQPLEVKLMPGMPHKTEPDIKSSPEGEQEFSFVGDNCAVTLCHQKDRYMPKEGENKLAISITQEDVSRINQSADSEQIQILALDSNGCAATLCQQEDDDLLVKVETESVLDNTSEAELRMDVLSSHKQTLAFDSGSLLGTLSHQEDFSLPAEREKEPSLTEAEPTLATDSNSHVTTLCNQYGDSLPVEAEKKPTLTETEPSLETDSVCLVAAPCHQEGESLALEMEKELRLKEVELEPIPEQSVATDRDDFVETLCHQEDDSLTLETEKELLLTELEPASTPELTLVTESHVAKLCIEENDGLPEEEKKLIQAEIEAVPFVEQSVKNRDIPLATLFHQESETKGLPMEAEKESWQTEVKSKPTTKQTVAKGIDNPVTLFCHQEDVILPVETEEKLRLDTVEPELTSEFTVTVDSGSLMATLCHQEQEGNDMSMDAEKFYEVEPMPELSLETDSDSHMATLCHQEQAGNGMPENGEKEAVFGDVEPIPEHTFVTDNDTVQICDQEKESNDMSLEAEKFAEVEPIPEQTLKTDSDSHMKTLCHQEQEDNDLSLDAEKLAEVEPTPKQTLKTVSDSHMKTLCHQEQEDNDLSLDAEKLAEVEPTPEQTLKTVSDSHMKTLCHQELEDNDLSLDAEKLAEVEPTPEQTLMKTLCHQEQESNDMSGDTDKCAEVEPTPEQTLMKTLCHQEQESNDMSGDTGKCAEVEPTPEQTVMKTLFRQEQESNDMSGDTGKCAEVEPTPEQTVMKTLCHQEQESNDMSGDTGKCAEVEPTPEQTVMKTLCHQEQESNDMSGDTGKCAEAEPVPEQTLETVGDNDMAVLSYQEQEGNGISVNAGKGSAFAEVEPTPEQTLVTDNDTDTICDQEHEGNGMTVNAEKGSVLAEIEPTPKQSLETDSNSDMETLCYQEHEGSGMSADAENWAVLAEVEPLPE